MAPKRKLDNSLQDSDLAVKRYGPAAAAKELSGLSTAENLRGWADIAKKNSGTYTSAKGEPRKLKPSPGPRGR